MRLHPPLACRTSPPPGGRSEASVFAIIPISQRVEGFWIVIGLMLTLTFLLLVVFRVRRWI
ncbi:MAG: hypothetical protein H7Y08_11280 [Rhizobiaceae bacterium]|nr:hypothetical protein [Rhizobiaceae bacterium]